MDKNKYNNGGNSGSSSNSNGGNYSSYNPNYKYQDPSDKWKCDVNDPAFVRHASRCKSHGEEYRKALNDQKK